jgi:hypothetical protein
MNITLQAAIPSDEADAGLRGFPEKVTQKILCQTSGE